LEAIVGSSVGVPIWKQGWEFGVKVEVVGGVVGFDVDFGFHGGGWVG